MENGSKPEILSISIEDLTPSPCTRSDGVTSLALPSPRDNSRSHSSTTLRETISDDGPTSLTLLSLGGNSLSHSRHPSNPTITSTDETSAADPDDFPRLSHPYPTASDVTTVGPAFGTPSSSTPTHVDSTSDIDNPENRNHKHKNSRKVNTSVERTPDDEDGGDDDGDDKQMELDLAQDEHIDPTPFAFKPYHLASLVDSKNLETLESMGGTNYLLAGLGVDPTNGLTDGPTMAVAPPPGEGGEAGDKSPREGVAYTGSIEDRQRVYGFNTLPARKSKPLLELMWLAPKDKVLIFLFIVALVSLVFDLLQDFGPAHVPGEPPVDWVEGVAIIVVISIVVMVGSLDDWRMERQFHIINKKKEERCVKVIRSAIERVIDVKELLVGDIALLEPGEVIPCDGIFVSGYNVKCDEPWPTGKSDAIKKVGYDDCIALREQAKREGTDVHGFDAPNAHTDCFMVSGSKVLEGYGKYVVIAVGQKSFNGRLIMALREDPDPTPLQEKLNDLAELTAKIGSVACLTLFAALMIRFFVQLGTGEPVRTACENGITVTQILMISVTLVVVAVPEGLPHVVTSSLVFAANKMTAENLVVRILGSCETVANTSVVCTDKTGTLTQNVMNVVAGSIGIHAKFIRNLKDNKGHANTPDQEQNQPKERDTIEPQVDRIHADDFSIEQGDINAILSPQLKCLLNQSITINSTAFEDIDPETKETAFVGTQTETALLQFAKDLGWENWRETRKSAKIIQMVPFSSERKATGVVVRLSPEHYRLFLKGDSEILTKKCTRHVVVSESPDRNRHPDLEIETKAIDGVTEENISKTTSLYADQMLRTIALCYRDFESWPPTGVHFHSIDEISYEELSRDMTLVATMCIEDPLRPDVRAAVADCRRAGVAIKMCTKENVLTAHSIATQCGIYTAGGIIMEGPDFRALDLHERIEVVPHLQVLARSSPEDKKLLVETLRDLGEIVGVTGGGTNDGPALETANVGFSMGISGTEVAKEISDIILMDDSFASIVKAIMWGRCVNDAVRKFLQFQVSASVVAVIITFVTTVAPSSGDCSTAEYVLTSVQLLWIDTMQSFAALALTTGPASRSLLERKPDVHGKRLFTADMIKMILGQSMYQVAIILTFHFLGHKILGLDHTEKGNSIVTALIHNTLVFAQVFNLVNCRRVDNELNIFEGILKNKLLVVIALIEIGGQTIIASVGGTAFHVTSLPGREWGISLALGFVSIPLGVIIRCIPTPPLKRAFIKMRIMSADEVLPTDRPGATEWNEAITKVRDGLSLFSSLRGGRANASSFILKRRRLRVPEGARIALPSLMVMVPTLIASAVGAGWASSRVDHLGTVQNDPSERSAVSWEGGVQLHQDPGSDDSASQRLSPGDRGESLV